MVVVCETVHILNGPVGVIIARPIVANHVASTPIRGRVISGLFVVQIFSYLHIKRAGLGALVQLCSKVSGGVDGHKHSKTIDAMRVAGSLLTIRSLDRALHPIRTPRLSFPPLSSVLLLSLSSWVL